MGFITGMKAIAEATAPREQKDFAKRLKLADGQAVTLRIINEMDSDSKHYDESRGLAGVVREHKSPNNWMRKAACTAEELGRCWACEQVNSKDSPWKAKQRFYFNTLVDDGKEAPYVAFWDVATFRSPVYETIKEQYMDTGSVSNMTWRLRRAGSGQTDTTYTFMPKAFDSESFDWKGIKPYGLEELVPTIPYEDQEEFYGGAIAPVADKEEQTTSSAIDW